MPASSLDRLITEIMEGTVQPDFGQIGRRAARRRTRRLARSVAVLAMVAGLSAGVLWGVLPASRAQNVAGTPSAPPSELAPFPDGPILWAGAGDATHLYAVLNSCGSCTTRLVASDDGGRTWTPRQSPNPDGEFPFPLTAEGARTLLAPSQGPKLAPPSGRPARVSTDGGRTWYDLVADATPAARVPAGGWLECGSDQAPQDGAAFLAPTPCGLQVVDPVSHTVRPLGSMPDITAGGVAPVPAGAGLWVMGLNRGWPAVSVSRDGGVTWSTSTFDGRADLDASNGTFYNVQVSTHDGRTVDVIVGHGAGNDYGFRSTDGGRTWAPTNGGAPLPHPLVMEWPSVTLPDGTHVLEQMVSESSLQPLTGVDGAGRYVAVARPGWPAFDMSRSSGQAAVHEANAGVYVAYDHRTLYYSTNGTDWRETIPRA